MVLRISFTIEAKADLDDMRDYLLPLNPQGLARVSSAIEACIKLVAEHPASGRPSPRDDVREAIEPRYGFLILYTVRGSVLYILRVYRGKRQPLDYELLPSPEDV
jgi:toxin ParE1/3/4